MFDKVLNVKNYHLSLLFLCIFLIGKSTFSQKSETISCLTEMPHDFLERENNNKDTFQSNTLNDQFKDYFLKKKDLKNKKIEVKTLSFLLDKYFPQKKIDLLDIDAEGFDYEVLKGIDFKKNIINLIMIEVHYFSQETIDKSIKIRNLLESEGFSLIYGDYPGNCVFKNKKLD